MIHKQDYQMTITNTQDLIMVFITLIESSQVNVTNRLSNVKLWHRKLGHMNYQSLKILFENQMATRL
jgi:hypothetical protein